MKKSFIENDKVSKGQSGKTEPVKTDKLSQIVELSLLYDFYGELLKEQQKQIFEDYILNDLSLSEIADLQGISRQGVHDTVKRCSKQLAEYENKLKLIDKFEKSKEKINRIKQCAEETSETRELDRVKEIIELSKEVLELL